jgi:hypothetical protein
VILVVSAHRGFREFRAFRENKAFPASKETREVKE